MRFSVTGSFRHEIVPCENQLKEEQVEKKQKVSQGKHLNRSVNG